ncbi:MAG TPA: flavin reductase family protein [Rubricoccaceae bacterium]|jgi:flavin reductase (DIM6/NTAB) family NADH-FMN oxidoreductase RutF
MIPSSTTITQIDPAPADRTPEHPEAVQATGAALRAILQAIASPVVVVTVTTGDETRGATIGSFASVSLDPPLVSFNVTCGTQLHAALTAADSFTVHLLADDQGEVATHFARPDLTTTEQSAGADLRAVPGLAVRLDGTLGTLACSVEARIRAGDHSVVIGRVDALVAGRDAGPLLYYRRTYRGVGGEV